MDWWRMCVISWSAPSKLLWSQKMCCLLSAEGKGQSTVVVRVYPKFSKKHSAYSVWEATNLVTEGFIQHVCTLDSLGVYTLFMFWISFPASLLGCPESRQRRLLSFCVGRQCHVSPSQPRQCWGMTFLQVPNYILMFTFSWN